jgi:serine/threonine-protein kinase
MARLDRLKHMINRRPASHIRLKIVFVFDELDKLEEFTVQVDGDASGGQKPVIDQVLGALKNLFTTSGVTFIFVAGKDLQERWLEDVGKGDSIYESVFSYDKYLPCMWTEVQTICDGLIDRARGMSAADVQVCNDFKKYLAFKGRGIPRRIIRTFNEYVEWSGNHPRLVFTRQHIRRIRFFAGLQSVLEEHEKQLFGDAHEEVPGTQSDKRRLGIYYLVDWILQQGAAEFTLTDVLNASKRLSARIALAEEIAPRVIEDVVKTLVEKSYLQEVHKVLDQVFIGDGKVGEGKRYKLAARRLAEMGGVAEDLEEDARVFTGKEKLLTSIGKYKLLKQLGRGGMGTVYQATDEQSGRIVAVKVLAEEWNNDSDIVARFEREAMIMNALRHPNIVQMYDWGKDGSRVYIVMEYLDGLTLDEIIRSRGKLGLEWAMAIATQVADTAHYVHQQGFVRNDLKPTNIMLTTAGRICLLDFGIAKSVHPAAEFSSQHDTQAGVIIGTPLFMAPEQFEHYVADVRSDVYSLGVVLYKMLTGVYPFDHHDFAQVSRAHLHETPKPLSHYVDVPEALEHVILKCLEKVPDQRYQTMEELSMALQDAAGELPQVDLRSLVSVAREKVKEIEAREREATRAASEFIAPAPAVSSSPVPPLSPCLDSPTPGTGVSTPPPQQDGRPILVQVDQSDNEGILLEGRKTFGRSIENDIVLPNPTLSRHHGAFTVEDNNCFIQDFNSANGTFVNGERVSGSQLLQQGDHIQIGDLIFVFKQTGKSWDAGTGG